MAFSIHPISDSVTWPIQRVGAITPLRPIADLEPHRDSATDLALLQEADIAGERDGFDEGAGGRAPSIADFMRSEVITIGPDATVDQLEHLLRHHAISGVPVVDPSSEELMGVVSLSDIAHHYSDRPHSAEAQGKGPLKRGGEQRVGDIMTPFVLYATEDTSVEDVADMMLRRHVHRVVITRDRKLVGVITIMDLLAHYRGVYRR